MDQLNRGKSSEVFQLKEIPQNDKVRFVIDDEELLDSSIQSNSKFPKTSILKSNEEVPHNGKRTMEKFELDLGESSESEYENDYVPPSVNTVSFKHGPKKNPFVGNGALGASEESLDIYKLNLPRSVEVTGADFIFSIVLFLGSLGLLVTDLGLAIWHFQDGFKWASGLTSTFLIFGAGSLLQQFNSYEIDYILRIFDKGKRIRILVNCLPPLAPIISSYEQTCMAYRSKTQQMLASRFFQIEDFSKGIFRFQSVFQSAPLAILQLVIYLETFSRIEPSKGVFTILNVILNLIVMTNGNLPSRTDLYEGSIRKAHYSPASKIFISIRMFSSFGSRVMSVSFLMVGARCLVGKDEGMLAFLLGIGAILLPRMLFSIIEFSKSLQKRNPNEEKMSQTCMKIFFGFLATSYFPVGDPLWVFWYVWGETALFLIFGSAVAVTTGCVDVPMVVIYLGVALVLFIVVPILIPYARALIKIRKIKKMRAHFELVREEVIA